MKKFYFQKQIDVDSERGRYLVACARIRNIPLTTLLTNVLDMVADDQLVLAVLDDNSKPERASGTQRFREVA